MTKIGAVLDRQEFDPPKNRDTNTSTIYQQRYQQIGRVTRHWGWCISPHNTSTAGIALVSGKPNVRTRTSTNLHSETRSHFRFDRDGLACLSSVRPKFLGKIRNRTDDIRY